ncbi:lytic transglycosylase domain-containing protein [Arenibaculum sp.]|uniref:lytic transglycosylase domain-containing protein n=1 Tax=Arenibaculum sp. TaxID=2865862 RepID=UPI002E13C9C5|nr:lytic transglycosylase domain-containing protein [Arenibaculum sp.]
MTIDRTPSPPLPARKPPVVQASAPLPGRKPSAGALAAAPPPTPGRKPEPPVQQAEAARTGAPAHGTPTEADRLGEAIRSVAGLSGHSFQTLLAQATQESGLDPKARSRTSSAVGPFQFLERTWLDMIRRHGAAYGLGDLARAVTVRDGVPVVADARLRKRILALREDPHLSAGMAARHLAEGREALSRRLGRPASEVESRMAYVMGAAGAAKLITAAERTPGVPASELLPKAAKANRPLFHDAGGRALPVREMVARLARRMEEDAMRLGALEAAGQGGAGAPEAPRRDDAPPNPLLFAQEEGSGVERGGA